ncbi:SAM-dependent methyltransferase [Fictibacillus aquaticus]|uniref:SAM-dependent methyltransferase n=2 Tax=Fictibacillus aquaticus TaxID=2021314 RepID=A0A235FBK7_9BACL|nr:SAM-dependent methyltransferase [Fictibacillus aquaticus]
MDLVGIESLLQLLRIKQPKRILEVGTAIGYSAIRMASSLPGTNIVTIEKDEERYHIASKNIEKAGLEGRITALFGDANELHDDVKHHGPFDVIFIDAAKGQYQKFFDAYTAMLASNGMVITDNVMFRGYVVDQTGIESRRRRALVRKIRAFNEYIMNHSDYDSALLPIGDGILVSIKKV